jgi:hypothetical protein
MPASRMRARSGLGLSIRPTRRWQRSQCRRRRMGTPSQPSGSPTSFAYQWSDCNASGGSCTNITGATSSSYTVATTDVGSTIEVTVTATNAGGSTSARSTATAMVPTPAPVNTAAPTITGTATVGSTLTAANGTWSNSPTSYGFGWQDCASSGLQCTNITGATSSSYTVASTDVGSTIEVTVTATNAGGSTSASSTATSTVPTPPPVNTAAPSITGTAQVSDELTASTGTWTNTPTSYSYQWRALSLGCCPQGQK